MKLKNKNSFQNRIWRLVTLACFFHFSGLNNGLTYFVITTAGENAYTHPSFTSAIAGKVGTVINPLNLKSFASKGFRLGWWFKSGQVIQHSSKRLVHAIIVETNLCKIWMTKTIESKNLDKNVETVSENSGQVSSVSQTSDISNRENSDPSSSIKQLAEQGIEELLQYIDQEQPGMRKELFDPGGREKQKLKKSDLIPIDDWINRNKLEKINKEIHSSNTINQIAVNSSHQRIIFMASGKDDTPESAYVCGAVDVI